MTRLHSVIGACRHTPFESKYSSSLRLASRTSLASYLWPVKSSKYCSSRLPESTLCTWPHKDLNCQTLAPPSQHASSSQLESSIPTSPGLHLPSLSSCFRSPTRMDLQSLKWYTAASLATCPLHCLCAPPRFLEQTPSFPLQRFVNSPAISLELVRKAIGFLMALPSRSSMPYWHWSAVDLNIPASLLSFSIPRFATKTHQQDVRARNNARSSLARGKAQCRRSNVQSLSLSLGRTRQNREHGH